MKEREYQSVEVSPIPHTFLPPNNHNQPYSLTQPHPQGLGQKEKASTDHRHVVACFFLRPQIL